MAEQSTLGGSGSLFVGEDKIIQLPVNDKITGLPVDMTGWVVLFDVRKTVTSPEPAILSLTATIVGVYNVNPLTNTQKAQVTLTDDHLNLFKAQTYQRSWKRMDAGIETVLAYGPFTPEKATAP